MPESETESGEVRRRARWTTVKVPVELRDRIKELAERNNKPEWRVVMEGLSFFSAQLKKPRLKEDASVIDKASWYIAKVAMSVGEFKSVPTRENLEKLRRTCQQIQERLGVDASLVVRVAETYLKDLSPDTKAELNMAVKMLVLDVINMVLVKEESVQR